MKNILLFSCCLLIFCCKSDHHYYEIHIWMEAQAHTNGDSLITIKKENIETINDYMKTYYYTAEFMKANTVIEKKDSLRIFTTGGNSIITIQSFQK